MFTSFASLNTMIQPVMVSRNAQVTMVARGNQGGSFIVRHGWNR